MRPSEMELLVSPPSLCAKPRSPMLRCEGPMPPRPRAWQCGCAAAVAAAGYAYVTLDLEGLRSGNLNRALDGG